LLFSLLFYLIAFYLFFIIGCYSWLGKGIIRLMDDAISTVGHELLAAAAAERKRGG